MSRMVGYTQREGSAVLIPDGLRRLPKAGDWRVKVTPRSRTEDMRRLALANGWTEAERLGQTAKVIADHGGHDSYIVKSKKVTRVRVKGQSPTMNNALMSGRVDGDYVRTMDESALWSERSVRERIREAVSAGIIAPEDAPAWARRSILS